MSNRIHVPMLSEVDRNIRSVADDCLFATSLLDVLERHGAAARGVHHFKMALEDLRAAQRALNYAKEALIRYATDAAETSPSE
jgi:hypothetical protein